MINLWEDILQWAIHTPSPHNVQPWKFKILNASGARLFIDRKRMLPKEDLTGSFVLSAMAMMVESLSLLAANRKHRLEVTRLYRGEDLPLIPFADLKLVPDETAQSEYEDALFKARRTSRLKYNDQAVAPEALAKLEKLAAGLGHRFGHSDDSVAIERAMQWNIEALFHDLNDPPYHDEIAEYFRCSDRETRQTPDGLDYRCMNLTRSELWICKYAPWLMRLPLLTQCFRWFYRKRLGPVRCMGWLSGSFWEQEKGLEAGKLLIRFWLETARLGLYFHPLGNLVTNKKAFGRISGQFKDETIWLIFKMGSSKEPPLSARFAVKDVLL